MKKRLLRWLRRLGIGVGILFLLLFLCWLFRWQLFGGLIRGAVTDALAAEGIEAEIGDMSGTLLGDVTVTSFRVKASPGHPEIDKAVLDHVHASYSLLGLATGEPGSIELVEIRGLRVALDLDRALPSDEPAEEPAPTEGGGFDRGLLPRRIEISGVDFELRSGGNRFDLAHADLDAECDAGGANGTYRASRAHLLVEGEERTGQPVEGRFDFQGELLEIWFAANDTQHGRVIAVDVGALEKGRLEAEVKIPLLDGRLEATASLDISGSSPSGKANLRLVDMDPQPAFRFLADVPVQLRRIDAGFEIEIPPGDEIDPATLSADFQISLDRPGYDVWGAEAIRLKGRIADGRILADGRFTGPDGELKADVTLTGDERVAASVDFPVFDLALLKQSPEGLPIRGTARILARAEGSLDNPDLRADVRVDEPRFGHFEADLLEVIADGTPEKSFLRHLLVENGADRLKVTGVVEPLEEVRFEGEVELEIAAVEKYVGLLPEGVPADAAGSLSVSVTTQGTPEAPNAKATIRMERARGADFGADRLLLVAEVPDVETFRLSRIEIDGAGGLFDLEIDGAAALIDAEGDATVTVDRVALARPEWGLEANLKARMDQDGAIGATVSLDSLDVEALARDLDLDLPVRGLGTGSIEIAGTVDAPEAVVRLVVASPTVAPDGRPEILADDLRLDLAYRAGVARLDRLRLGGPDWELTASGSVPLDLEDPEAASSAAFEDLELKFNKLPLALAGPVPGLKQIRGTLSGSFGITGTVEAPSLAGGLTLDGGGLVLEDLPDLPIEKIAVSLSVDGLTPEGGSIRVDRIAAGVLGTQIAIGGSLRLEEGGIAAPDLTVTAEGADLGRLFGVLAPDLPVKGIARLKVGVRPEPRITLDLSVTDMEVSGHTGCSLDLGTEWRDGSVVIRRGRFVAHDRELSISGTAPLDLSLAPFEVAAPVDRPLDIRFRSDGLELADLVADEPSIRLTGRAFVDVSVRGTYESPRPEGTVTIEGARCRLPGAPPISDLDGTVRLHPDRITIEHLKGSLGRGTLNLSGTVDLVDQAPARIDLALTAENAQLVREAGLRLRANLGLTIKGPSPEKLTVAGTMTIRRLRAGGTGLFATQDLELLLESLRSQPSLAPLPMTTDPMLKDVALNVVVKIPPGSTKIRNNLVNLAVEGELVVGGNLAVPRPDGRIYIPKGGIVYLVAGELEIDRAVVTFKRSEPLRPYVTARAMSEIGDTEIYVDITGAANDPKILFSSVPPYDEANIVSLLLTGVTRDQLGTGGAARGFAQAYLLRQLSSNLSGDDSEEPSTLSEIARRVEVEVDTKPVESGGTPAIRATVEILEWLFVRVSQEAASSYGADLIYRITRP